MKRVAIHTLGCKLNFAESSTLGRQFSQRGYSVVGIDEPAEVCVINTCSVTERADRECRQIVRRALRHSPNAFVAVIGCYAQLQPEEIATIEGVDLVLGAKEKFNLFDYTGDLQKRSRAQVAVTPIQEVDNFGHASSIGFTDRTRAFLKIQDGCDYTCAFCTIPLARGASRSVSVSEIIKEAREVVAQGYKEIVLTGVNVGDYGKKNQTSLLVLLQEMVKVDGLERIRVSSIEPNLLSDELIDFWLDSEKLCKHFHIPLQSGTDDVLRNMRRRYLTDWYASRVERIKSVYPSAGIGVDVITGFPGETDELFERTYRFLNELPVSYLHVFTYSERPNTVAATLPEQVEPRVRFERNERLRILSMKKRRVFHESFIGKTANVLFESETQHGRATGLSSEYVRVVVDSEDNLTNKILPVLITGADHEACSGAVVAEKSQEVESVYA
ncbi:MAG: tRNA (N(6)-L-threonylcarbamoyladenosine(37)-C(2))-methylthiotransferase MtaB [Ignavibacteriae bacterium]|nr:tRNA (N(6)-L-threonylcarbamoyladenosine(37)-C(2))-methylthiotransferase MtaB [Ignavibacteriota bacterium]